MVDAAGNVTSATKAVGTSIADMELVGAALKAARQARFSAAEGQDVQRGTITYVFRRTK
ncbi:MAG: energy transducer TonB [Alistipes putredinis]|nr:MAG: energy transducer TonB [Alistipes putredinis]